MIKTRVDFKIKRGINITFAKPVWHFPITRGVIVLHSGSYLEPRDKQGLSSLFYDMLNERIHLLKKMDSIGARVYANSSLTKSFIYFTFLNERLRKSFRVLESFLKDFELKEEIFERVKKKRLDKIAIMEQEPDYIITTHIHDVLYGKSALSNRVGGLRETILNITLQDIKGFYEDHFKSSPVDVIIVSDVVFSNLKKYSERLFEQFIPEPPVVPNVNIKYRSENLTLIKKHLHNSYISFFAPLKITDFNEYLSARIFSYIMGEGSFNSRLMKKLREELGLVYFVSSNVKRGFIISNKNFGGYLDILADTGRDSADRVKDEMYEILQGMLEGNIRENELGTAKQFYKNIEKRRGETYKDILSVLLTEKIYELEKNFYKGLPERIEGISMKDIYHILSVLKRNEFSSIRLEGEGG